MPFLGLIPAGNSHIYIGLILIVSLCWIRHNNSASAGTVTIYRFIIIRLGVKENQMGILSWILVGLIAGWLADSMMKGRGQGVVFSIILGIVGALVGGFLASELLGVNNAVNGFNIGTLIVAFLGAVITIAVVRALPGRSPV
jgi:uncharacterized membrane protein YeaQ/YmgE (transglycosylase-associated protein family)